MIDLTPIFQAIIALLAALITYKLIPWLRARTTAAQQANITALAKIAVYAAEQIYGAGKGDEKFAYAREVLRAAGFDVDPEVIKAEIEHAVYNLPPLLPILSIAEPADGETETGEAETETPEAESGETVTAEATLEADAAFEPADAEKSPGDGEPPPCA